MEKNFKNIKVNKLPDSEVEITGEISLELVEKSKIKALKELNSKSNLAGFRPGHIPESVLIKNLGEMRVLEEAAEIALGEEYPHILKEAGIIPIGTPMVAITKLAPKIPLEFKVTTAVEPEFSLPDYKKLAQEVNQKEEEIKVEENEIKEVIESIRREKAHHDLHEKIGNDNHDHAPIEDKDLPEVNDLFAQSIGDFVDLSDLKIKIEENLLKEKVFRAKEKRRLGIIESLIKETTIPVPKVLVESELSKMLAEFRGDVTRSGLKFEEYLTSIKKTEEDIKNEWREKAEARVKAELLVAKIAVEEKIEPSEVELEKETQHLISHYADADPLRARIYVYTMMRNEKVFEFLEGLK
jgi:FKBP-type peptidyl-prolyl cis-trans isomerase (trigger factor)